MLGCTSSAVITEDHSVCSQEWNPLGRSCKKNHMVLPGKSQVQCKLQNDEMYTEEKWIPSLCNNTCKFLVTIIYCRLQESWVTDLMCMIVQLVTNGLSIRFGSQKVPHMYQSLNLTGSSQISIKFSWWKVHCLNQALLFFF